MSTFLFFSFAFFSVILPLLLVLIINKIITEKEIFEIIKIVKYSTKSSYLLLISAFEFLFFLLKVLFDTMKLIQKCATNYFQFLFYKSENFENDNNADESNDNRYHSTYGHTNNEINHDNNHDNRKLSRNNSKNKNNDSNNNIHNNNNNSRRSSFSSFPNKNINNNYDDDVRSENSNSTYNSEDEVENEVEGEDAFEGLSLSQVKN